MVYCSKAIRETACFSHPPKGALETHQPLRASLGGPECRCWVKQSWKGWWCLCISRHSSSSHPWTTSKRWPSSFIINEPTHTNTSLQRTSLSWIGGFTRATKTLLQQVIKVPLTVHLTLTQAGTKQQLTETHNYSWHNYTRRLTNESKKCVVSIPD